MTILARLRAFFRAPILCPCGNVGRPCGDAWVGAFVCDECEP